MAELNVYEAKQAEFKSTLIAFNSHDFECRELPSTSCLLLPLRRFSSSLEKFRLLAALTFSPSWLYVSERGEDS
jgi:hypothetical protein